jgi:lysozyme family protein
MEADFLECTRRLLKSEGGYCNVAGDPGGPTNFGITIYDARKYLNPSADAGFVRAMSVEQAIAIYRTHYWNAMHLSELPAGLDYAVYDYGVNSGQSRPFHVLQTLMGLPVTGQADAATIGGLKRFDVDRMIDALCAERLQFMHGIRGGAAWNEFGSGWGTRVASVRQVSHRMKAGGSAGSPNGQNAPDHMPLQPSGKATHIDPGAKKKVIQKTAGGAVVGGTAGSAGHSLALGIGIGIGIAVGVAVIGGVVYYLMHRRQQAAQVKVVIPANVNIAGLPIRAA